MSNPLTRDTWSNTAYSSSVNPSTPSTIGVPTSGTTTSSFARDPKIFGMPSPSLTSPPVDEGNRGYGASSGPGMGDGMTSGQSAPHLKVRISGLERNRKDLLVRFDVSTNLPNFRATLYRNMQRSYVEFQLFAEQMAYSNPHTIVPALPLPNTSAVTDEEDDRLVRISLQRWLSRVCEDPVLQKEDELRSFLESDFGYQPTPRHGGSTPFSSSSSRSSSSRVGVSMPSVTLPSALTRVFKRGPPDEDEDLAAAKGEIEKLEERWGGLAVSVGKVGSARRAIATAEADTGAKLISLATVEPSPELSNAIRKVGRGFESLAGVAQAQAVSDNVVLSDPLGYQSLNARAAKETLLNRIQVLEDAQNASKVAITKRRTLERLKGSSNISSQKVDDAIGEMQDAQELDSILAQRVQAISNHLRTALQTHSRQAHEDAASILLEFARTKIMYERQTLKELEALRPDLKSVGRKVEIGKMAVGKQQVGMMSGEEQRREVQRGAAAVVVPPSSMSAPLTTSWSAPPIPQPTLITQGQPAMTQSLYLPGQPPQPPYSHGQYQPQSQYQPPYQPQTRQLQAPYQPSAPPLAPQHTQSYSAPPQQVSYQQLPPQFYQPPPPPNPHAMAQSMFLPPSSQQQQPSLAYAAQRRRLDDKAAARSLANMF